MQRTSTRWESFPFRPEFGSKGSPVWLWKALRRLSQQCRKDHAGSGTHAWHWGNSPGLPAFRPSRVLASRCICSATRSLGISLVKGLNVWVYICGKECRRPNLLVFPEGVRAHEEWTQRADVHLGFYFSSLQFTVYIRKFNGGPDSMWGPEYACLMFLQLFSLMDLNILLAFVKLYLGLPKSCQNLRFSEFLLEADRRISSINFCSSLSLLSRRALECVLIYDKQEWMH